MFSLKTIWSKNVGNRGNVSVSKMLDRRMHIVKKKLEKNFFTVEQDDPVFPYETCSVVSS